MQSEQINELANALVKAQSAMKAATYNKVNPHFKNKYADLAAVIEAVRKPLSDNGLSVSQTTELTPESLVLRTTLFHTSGQWIASEYPLPSAANPQQLGSALTYARRYSLSCITCLAADEDDDGDAADTKDIAKPRYREPESGPQPAAPRKGPTPEEIIARQKRDAGRQKQRPITAALVGVPQYDDGSPNWKKFGENFWELAKASEDKAALFALLEANKTQLEEMKEHFPLKHSTLTKQIDELLNEAS